ncbi:hypothetical protein BC941DRAFT_409295 [Chlamydoabsidia padenii]|nr:hypothetical protein BC941DRAFT_409295 [Chlamydoabsidia padenii]
MLKLIPHIRQTKQTAHRGAQSFYSTLQNSHTTNSSTQQEQQQQQPIPGQSLHRTKPPNQSLFNDETRAHLEMLRQHHFHASNLPDSPDFGINQYLNINEELRQQLKDIVGQFHAPVRYAFAYGSGVFRQSGYDEKVRLKDIL